MIARRNPLVASGLDRDQIDRLEIWLMQIDARSGRLEKKNGRPRGGHNDVHNQREKIE